MKKIKTLGIDLAKNVFQLHGADEKGKKVYGKKVKRKDLFTIVDTLEKDDDFLIAMETCGGSHHIARTFMEKGYQARIIHAKFVKPYVKSNKNDAVDAEAIAEASRRPNMRFAGIKSREQQDIQSIHRVREQFIKRRTATANEMRGLLMEYGITIPQGINKIKKNVTEILSDPDNGLTMEMRDIIQELYSELLRCFKKVEHYDEKLQRIYDEREDCKRLGRVDGVGFITATALVASVGDPSVFKNGRQFAAWLGLTPKQVSTGGKTKLLGISKRGDKCLRKNLIHGCRSVVRYAKKKNR